MNSKLTGATLAIFSIALTACGGGGGGGTPLPPPSPLPTINPGQLVTNASGKVVDDANGSPLAGVSVTIAPWTAGATPLPAPVATTDTNGNFTLTAAPNGHFLLIIGSNSATDTTRATVHDNVTFSGGNQTLTAPTLPVVHAYPAPAWETNGDYRLAVIDATTEAPCLTRFNADRANVSQPAVPFDEWSLENARANVANQMSVAISTAKYISTQNTQVSTSNPVATCNIMVDSAFPPSASPYANDALVTWFGGKFVQASGVGTMEAPFDPRGYSDPNFPVWP